MAEVGQLLDQEIPDGRQHLQESYVNLDKVAQYCRENYLKSQDKKAALEETKNYTTHSLASVAYQINSLATNFLKLLDLQQNVVAEMESSVNYLSQTVNIHKEKVARREIGVLTSNKSSTRPLGVKNGIIFPEQAEKPTKYQRKPIDFSMLDEIGHGVKVHDQGIMKTGGGVQRQPSRNPSISSQAPTTRPPTPPMTNAPAPAPAPKSHYRTPAPPVAPPSIPMAGGPGPFNSSVPSNYSMGQITALPGQHSQGQPGQRSSSRSSGYSQGPPPVGMAHPQTRQHIVSQTSVDALPPPPSPGTGMSGDSRASEILEASPPLPPPPPQTDQNFDYPAAPPPPPQFDDIDEEPPREEDPYAPTGPLNLMTQDWVPNQYLEKVIAIYDYDADKSDELSFSENSVVYVIKKNDDGWYEGVCNGVTGLFPGNYVEHCM